MGLIDYRTPTSSASAGDYMDFYRNYRGPKYQGQMIEQPALAQPTAPEATGAPMPESSGGGDGGGYAGDATNSSGYANTDGWGGAKGSQAITGVDAGKAGNIGGLLGAVGGFALGGLGLANTGYNVGSKVGTFFGEQADKSVNNIVNSMEAEEGSTGRQFGSAQYGLSPMAVAMAQADAQAQENDAQGGYGGSQSSMAGGWGGWGGFGGGYGGDEGSGEGSNTGGYGGGPGANGGEDGGASDGNGWKTGGMIKNRRGLLDGEDTSQQDAKPFRGLLEGPITKERDNIPAVNKTTGEKIAVESGEYVMTRKAVKAKGAKFFERINKEAEKQ